MQIRTVFVQMHEVPWQHFAFAILLTVAVVIVTRFTESDFYSSTKGCGVRHPRGSGATETGARQAARRAATKLKAPCDDFNGEAFLVVPG